MAKDKKPAKKVTSKKSATPKKVTKSKVKPEGKKSPDPIQTPTVSSTPTDQPTIDVPRMEGQGVITIPEPVDRPPHWTDGMKAEWKEREEQADEKTYRCLSCGAVRKRESGDKLPAGDERCSHEWEEAQIDSYTGEVKGSGMDFVKKYGSKPGDPPPSQSSGGSYQKVAQGFGQFAAKAQQQETARLSNSPPHIVTIAFAGTGKTTSHVEGIKKIKGLPVKITPSPEQQALWDEICKSRYYKFMCFVAFSNSIAAELRERVPQGVDAKTLHGMGFQAVRRAFQLPDDAVKRGEERIPNIIAEVMQADIRVIRKECPSLVSNCERLVNFCKYNLVGLDDDNDPEYWHREIECMAYNYELDLDGTVRLGESEVSMMEMMVRLVPKVLRRCLDVNKDKCITFPDMIWLPVALDLPMFKFDILFVDEAQDMNKCQHALIKKAGRRLVLCGDPNQSIMGFAGADSDSMPTIMRYLGEQPQGYSLVKLTVTRRCGKAIVREANQEVPELVAHPDNPEGIVRTLKYPLQPMKKPGGERGTIELKDEQTYLPEVQPGDMILCRSVAPLVSQYFKLLKRGVAAVIQGKDLAQQIINLITKMKVSTVPELIGKVDDWLQQEIEKEQAKRNPRESYLQNLRDRAECVRFFCKDQTLVRDVIKQIESVFVKSKDEGGNTKEEEVAKVRLMSIHKAKGLESKRVFYLRPAVYPGRREDKMMNWQVQEERNLRYVAKTRAIEELTYVV